MVVAQLAPASAGASSASSGNVGGKAGSPTEEVRNGRLMKEIVKEQFCHYQVDKVDFGALDPDEIARYAEIEVLNREFYDLATRTPISYGPVDRRMGPPFKHEVCGTCGQKLEECNGHFGFVRLALPIFHVGYFNHTYQILQSLCKACGRLLLAPESRPRFLNRLRRANTDQFQISALHKRVREECKKVRHCPYCGAYNAAMKKGSGIPLLVKHQVGAAYKGTPDEVSQAFKDSFQESSLQNRELEAYVEKAHEDVNPLNAYNLLENMTPQDRELLGIVDPTRLLVTSVPVPPTQLRPTVHMGDAGMAEDDLTHQISEIIDANAALRNNIERGNPTRNVMEAWQFLQEKAALYVNSEAAGLQLPKGRPIRSICTRLKGKEGRFRGNLSGKRVDFSGRTVISPDPNVSVEEVVVPTWVAKRMTFPERVCEASITRLREAVQRGPEEHPGACFVKKPDGSGKFLGYLPKRFRTKVADELQCGDLVERHMRDGDIVLFNRQPSLHRLSIMAHKAKVMHGRTFRFNECVCGPYNADFDGDEMNLHLPQTEEARAEALQLMGVRDGLVTPKSGEVAICATQDFLTASFLLTQKNVFLSRDKFCQICCTVTDGLEHVELPPPAILKPCELWTGKQVYNVLLRPNRHCGVLVNLEVPEKNYTKKDQSMCKDDGWVIFRNSELISGNLGKKVLGGAKSGLFFRLIRDNSREAAIMCMGRLAKVTSRWLASRGFTIGIDDVTAHAGVKQEKRRITREKYAVVDERIKEYREGTIQLKAGCNAEQTLEAMVNGELGRIRDLVGGMCEEKLQFMNKPRIMAQCGSKGSPINLCQMMACVGQQNVGGRRIKDGFVNRTLPHFLKDSKEPKARGFVDNSFYSGLEPTEFFFHTMAGREGLVDTAVKTAETGYMQRRLIKALEDLSLKYDLTVRTSAGDVVQFIFGDDGMNPARMEGSSSKPLDFEYVMQHVQYVLRPPRRFIDGTLQRSWVGNGTKAGASRGVAKRRRLNGAQDSEDMQTPALLPVPQISARSTSAVPRTADELKDEGYRSVPLLPQELRDLAGPYAECFSAFVRQTHGSAELDLSAIEGDLANFIRRLASSVAEKRTLLKVEPADTPESAEKARANSAVEDSAEREAMLSLADAGMCPTQYELEAFVNRCAIKYVQAQLMPGEAVGAVAAQSIGEPATQMTLKTFHFAGVASMNVTLGVPRIKEIINAAKSISTPIITCHLNERYSEVTARIIQGRIQATKLGDVTLYYKEVYDPALGSFISVKIDLDTIRKLQLELVMEDIKEALMKPKNVSGIRLGVKDVVIVKKDKLRVYPPQRHATGNAGRMLYFHLQALKSALPHVVIKGLPSAKRAVINKDEDKKEKVLKYHLLVEGYGLRDVMNIPGIEANHTKSNHVMEVEKVLGIEAARATIMKEIDMTMGSHGISVDARHIQMLGDCMTYRGQVLGINRYGIARMRTSALYLASFERTNDHIFDAAVHQRSDPVTGVSECIILGTTVKLGTGLFKLLYDFGGKQSPQAAGSTLAGANSTAGGTSGSAGTVGSTRTPLLSGWRKPG
mmetsp:Transcript_151744/g.263752  ORF Transcript_151744/g.263752 Transcript_151744/m.263752 type:complete len:1553 (+) Transcript_151744:163-4821(+)